MLFGPLLMGCGISAPDVEIIEVRVPAPLLSREPEPVPPDGKSARDTGVYIIDLRQWGAGCDGKLETIAALQEAR